MTSFLPNLVYLIQTPTPTLKETSIPPTPKQVSTLTPSTTKQVSRPASPKENISARSAASSKGPKKHICSKAAYKEPVKAPTTTPAVEPAAPRAAAVNKSTEHLPAVAALQTVIPAAGLLKKSTESVMEPRLARKKNSGKVKKSDLGILKAEYTAPAAISRKKAS